MVRGFPALTERIICLVLPRLLVVKIEAAVDALVGAFLFFRRARAHKAERPPLELERVFFRESIAPFRSTGSPMTS